MTEFTFIRPPSTSPAGRPVGGQTKTVRLHGKDAKGPVFKVTTVRSDGRKWGTLATAADILSEDHTGYSNWLEGLGLAP